jgi:LCP family protein required for cell wall assembly
LLGSDSESSYVGRTDSILIVLINRETGAASLLSIPRDLFVYIPGWTMERINIAYSLGGWDLLTLTLEYNLGLRPDYWALVRFEDFVRFINDLGGIDVPVSHPLPDDCGGIPSGTFRMSGEAALCYVRERQTSSDVDRSRRQQEVLAAILDRVWSLDGLRQLPEWYDRYEGSIESNLWLYDLIELIPVALKFQDAGLQTYQIGWDQVTPWQDPESGAMVLLPKREEVSYVIQQAVNAVQVPIPTSPALETRIAILTATVTPLPTETQEPAIEPAVLPSETSMETPKPNDD